MRCFSSAFPDATHNEIRTARIENIHGWDSLRGVTLLALLDEQFHAQIDLPELLELGTFDAVKEHLLKRAAEEPKSECQNHG